MKAMRRALGAAATSRELVVGLARNGRYWLIPLVGMLGLCALLLGVVYAGLGLALWFAVPDYLEGMLAGGGNTGASQAGFVELIGDLAQRLRQGSEARHGIGRREGRRLAAVVLCH